MNGAGVAGEREPRVERVDDVERVQELADGVGRVADVEVLRDAAEQVVAGDQQPLLGLVQADVRRRVAGRLDHLPGAGVGLDHDARDEVAVGVQRPRLAGAHVARAPSAQRRSGSSGTPLCSATSIVAVEIGRARVQLPVGCIQTSQPARSAIGGACPQWSMWAWVITIELDVAEPEARRARARARGCPSSRGRACPCRRARSRRRPAAPTRCSAARRAARAAAAAARCPAAPARRGRPHAFSWACAPARRGTLPSRRWRRRPAATSARARPTANTATSTARCSRCAAR